MTGGEHESAPAAKLMVGLVPTWRFQDDGTIQPWREYNGSVIIDISDMKLSALHRKSDTEVAVEPPVFNQTWQVGRSDSFRDSFMTSDDNLYILMMEIVPSSGTASTLIRTGFRGEEIWRKTWIASEGMLAHSVAAMSNEVYVLGTIYGPGVQSRIGLFALDSNGNPLWNTTLDYSDSDYPGDVGVNSAGEIYGGISTALSPNRNVLIKLDYTGELLWEVFFGGRYDRVYDVEVCENGNIYTRTESLLALCNDKGEVIWSVTGQFDDAYALANGNVLTTHSESDGAIGLVCHNLEGEEEWTSLYGIMYTQDWWDFVTISSAIDGPNETIFVLLWTYGYHPGRILLHLDGAGIQLSNRTLSFSDDLYNVQYIPQYFDMYMDSNGLFYFVGEYLDRIWEHAMVVGVYDFYGVTMNIANSFSINTSLALTLMVLVMVGIEARRRASQKN